MDNLCGIINIYKEKGYTSHDVVNIIRKTLGKVKTGHTGTLDPDAEGVLPICIGKATKIADYISSDIKQYKTILTLGVTTDTQDSTGKVLEVRPVNCSKQEILSAVLSFKGEYFQTPPMYSALKHNGRKLYEIAREGKEIERKKRLINIYNIEVSNFIDSSNVEVIVLCSKGTYIRTLCSDIGEKLNCGGHMSYLLRTRTGKFYLKDSIKINQFKDKINNNEYDIIQPIDKVMDTYKKVIVNEDGNKLLYNGNKISFKFINSENLIEDEKLLVYNYNNNLIGIYEVYNDFIKPLTMLI